MPNPFGILLKISFLKHADDLHVFLTSSLLLEIKMKSPQMPQTPPKPKPLAAVEVGQVRTLSLLNMPITGWP